MTVCLGIRAKFGPFFRHRLLPLSIYSSIFLSIYSSSRCYMSLYRNWLLLSSIVNVLFHTWHLSLFGDWFLSFPGCRSQCLSISFLPFLKDSFFFPWDRHRSFTLQNVGISRFLQSLISLKLSRLRVCVTLPMRFVQASQDASLVTRQSDAHLLQLIWPEVATLS